MSHGDLEFEPVPGLPHELPPGERLVWQGRPSWRGLARRPFHLGWLALYLGAVVLARGLVAWSVTHRLAAAASAAGAVLPLALACLGLVLVVAVLHARGTVYTMTTERLVMRLGIALPMTFNVPFRRIASAGVRLGARGEGDIVLDLSGPDRLAYAHLWPHVEGWSFRRARPMLRSVPDAARVAELLGSTVQAWAEAATRPSARPEAETGPQPMTPRPAATAGAHGH